jgi:plasmid maintenance system antidote protein VapI
MTVSPTVPNRLAAIMAEQLLDRDAVADLAGVHRRTVDRLIEAGQDVRVSTALAIARALGVSLSRIWETGFDHE